VIVAAVSACAPSPRPSTAEILASLPISAGGEDLSVVRVIDPNFPSGHVVDDVLNALGKQRSQASIVFRYSSGGSGYLGGIAVDEVDGRQLLQAIGLYWQAAALVLRSQTPIRGHEGVELTFRDGSQLIAYNAGRVIYVASADDPNIAQEYIDDMP
jgi:hypothetical protein